MQQNANRNRIGWIVLALLCLGIGVMVGGRGAAFMSSRNGQNDVGSAQFGPGMRGPGHGQMMQPGEVQAPAPNQQVGPGAQIAPPAELQAPDRQSGPAVGREQRGPRFSQQQAPVPPTGPVAPGMMHDRGHGHGGFLFGILGLIGHLLKIAVLALAGLLLLRLWRDRNDPNDTRRWPWQRKQSPEPGTTDPPYTGNTSSL